MVSTGRSPTTSAALALLVIAALGVAAWFLVPGLKAWAPNITVGALTVAATITVIDGAVRREAQRRLRPRLESVKDAIRHPLHWVVWAIADDYVETHKGQPAAVPGDAIGLAETWLKEENEQREKSRGIPEEDALPRLAIDALQFIDELEDIRARDREVLEPEVVRAIDDFAAAVRQASQLYLIVDAETNAEARSSLAIYMGSIVAAVYNLCIVLRRHWPDIVTFDRKKWGGTRTYVERIRRAADENA